MTMNIYGHDRKHVMNRAFVKSRLWKILLQLAKSNLGKVVTVSHYDRDREAFL